MSVVVSEDEVSEIARKVFRSENEVLGYSVEPARDYPTGFLGEHRRLKVRISRGGEVEQRVCFVKKLPDGAGRQRQYLQQVRCFFKEIGMYAKVFPRLEEAAEGVTKWRAECYLTRGEELIVLEDLTQDGYYMYPERTLMDEEHVLSSLAALARMHASSIIYEEKLKSAGGRHSTIAEEFSEFLFESVATADKGHPGNTAQEAGISAQLKIVDLLPGYSKQQKELIKKELPFRLRRLFHLVKPSRKFRNVIVHGDIWANNILFLKDVNGNVKNAKIVDFQLARYAPPAHDIATFLHLVQTKKFREENLQELLKHYYDVLSSCLAKNGLRVQDVLTWYELLGTWDYYEELGVITAIFFFQLILTPPHLCKKYFSSSETCVLLDPVKRSEVVTECFLQDPLYAERVTEIMNVLINEYIL